MQAITSSYISSGSARGLPFSSSCLVSPRPESIRQSTYLCKAACASFVYISSWNSTLRQQHFPIRRLSAVRQMWASSYSREKSITSQKHKHTHPHTHIQCRCEKLGQTRWLGFDYVWAKSDGCEANSPLPLLIPLSRCRAVITHRSHVIFQPLRIIFHVCAPNVSVHLFVSLFTLLYICNSE